MAAICIQIFPILALLTASVAGHMRSEDVEIPVRNLRQKGLLNPRFRYDNNERNTSANYDYWERAGFYMFEWPGNITSMDPSFPLVRWGRNRARYLQSPCEKERGMELAVYAYKHLHLTWGANRLTQSYCQPLRIRRQDLPMPDQRKPEVEITAIDFEFVFDALLMIIDQGYIVRAGDIELSYAKVHPKVRRNLTFTLPNGVHSKVNRIVAQKCCSKSKGLCSHGDTIAAYNEFGSDMSVFISYDGGNNFKALPLSAPSTPQFVLQSIIFYPNYRRLDAFYGTSSNVCHQVFSSINGSSLEPCRNIVTQGYVQAQRINNEYSFVLWDNCTVWYGLSSSKGLALNQAKFYKHESIRNLQKGQNSHLITWKHCHLGIETLFAFGESKIGLLDTENNFLYGIDAKSTNFSMVAITTDMSLMFSSHRRSICPTFDRNNRPKFVYPPRYLRLPKQDFRDEHYEKRLAMRILKKTLFPSDFMLPFFEENIFDASTKSLGLRPCEASYLSVDGSISQKPKEFSLGLVQPLRFQIVFQSTSNRTNQLETDPKILRNFLNSTMRLVQATRMGEDRYWFKFEVEIVLKEDFEKDVSNGDAFLITFHAKFSLRCVHQPYVHVWLTIDREFFKEPKRPSNKRFKAKSTNEAMCAKSENKPLRISACEGDLDTLASGTCIHPNGFMASHPDILK